MRIVNTVWKGALGHPCILNDVQVRGDYIASVRYQVIQPEQLIIKFTSGGSMLLFKSGKFRVMGGGDDLELVCNAYAVIFQISTEVPEMKVQTMTVTYTYPSKVNLHMVAKEFGYLDCETFPALQIRKYKPVHVNLFSSGKVIICGIKVFEIAHDIKSDLDSIIERLNV